MRERKEINMKHLSVSYAMALVRVSECVCEKFR